jgi:hypothetical protein
LVLFLKYTIWQHFIRKLAKAETFLPYTYVQIISREIWAMNALAIFLAP